tara:strand:+ start:1223 stop:2158 length:936 start_codon:yes stop_codon:yes gene_type:complete
MTKNIIEIYNPTSKELVKNINKYDKIFVILDFIKNKNIIKRLKILNDNNFTNPYITNISPKNIMYENYVLCLERDNNIKNKYNLINNIILLLKTYNNIKNKYNCYYNIRFSKCCINSLRDLSYKGFSFDSSNLSQNEIAGNFYVKILHNNIIELCLNKNSIIEGTAQGVKIKEGMYNFHTHPKKAYKDNKVKIGWPSAQDYLGFLNSYIKYKTILHVVITLEGLYLLTLKKILSVNFINKNYNKIKTQILENFRNTKDEKNTYNTEWYIKNINKQQILGKKMFNTIFLNWENVYNKKIKIYYDNNKLCKIN